jgi:hypothetical protein
MRHFILRSPIAALAAGVMVAATAALLVAAARLPLFPAAGCLRAEAAAIALTPVATTADRDQVTALRTQEESGNTLQRGLSKNRERWTLLPRKWQTSPALEARGAQSRVLTAKFESGLRLLSW